MRRPTFRNTAGILAIGAAALAVPSAFTVMTASARPSTVLGDAAPGTTVAPAPSTTAPGATTTTPATPDSTTPADDQTPAPAPAPDEGAAPQGPNGPGPNGPNGKPGFGTIDPAAMEAYQACITEHGGKVPTPAKPPQGQPPKPPQGQPQPQNGEAPGGQAPDEQGQKRQPAPPAIDDATKAAIEACKDLRPKPTFTDEQIAKIRAYEQCMKDNGVEIPPFDPNAEPTKNEPGSKPQIDPEKMKAAQEACKDLNPFPRGPGGPGPRGQQCVPGENGMPLPDEDSNGQGPNGPRPNGPKGQGQNGPQNGQAPTSPGTQGTAPSPSV